MYRMLITLCQCFGILFLKSFLVRNVTPPRIPLLVVTGLWTEIKDDLNDTKYNFSYTSNIMGHPTFQSTCDIVLE